ncbi:MAG: response regulator [Pseudanabaenaceae cyanobacterium]
MTQDQQQQRIMGYFIEEAREHLQTIEQGILNLQDVLRDEESVNELFRAAHSIKGGSAMLGVGSVQHISHRLEDFFKILKDNQNIAVDEHLTSLLLAAFDRLQELLDELQSSFHINEVVAEESLRQLNPVFVDLEQHLETLRVQSQQSRDQTQSATAHHGMGQSQASPEPVRESQDQAFQTAVNDDLREMLQLFKGQDDSNSRYSLQEIASRIQQYGVQFGVPAWTSLLSKIEQVVGNTALNYREIAPVVIREIKQAQEQFISGEGHQISPSKALLDLLPKRAVVLEDDEISMIFGAATEVNDDDISMGLSLDQVLARREWEIPRSGGNVTAAAGTLQTNISNEISLDQNAAAVGNSDIDMDDLLVTIPAMDWGNSSMGGAGGDDEGDVDGPKIGESELKTLANLFDNEDIDFEAAWEDIESNETQVANQANGLPDDDSLADLLGTSIPSNLVGGEENTDTQMITLFGDDFGDSEVGGASGLFPQDMADLASDFGADVTSGLPSGTGEDDHVLFPDDVAWEESEALSEMTSEMTSEIIPEMTTDQMADEDLDQLEGTSAASQMDSQWNEFTDLFSGEIEPDLAIASVDLERQLDESDLVAQASDSTLFNDNDWNIFDEEDEFNGEISEQISADEVENEPADSLDDNPNDIEGNITDEMDEFSSDDLYSLDQEASNSGETSSTSLNSGEPISFDFDDQDLVNFANQLKDQTSTDADIDPSVDTLVEDGFSLGFADAIANATKPEHPEISNDAPTPQPIDFSSVGIDELGFSTEDLYSSDPSVSEVVNDYEIDYETDYKGDDENDEYNLLNDLFDAAGEKLAAATAAESDSNNQWDSFDGIGDDEPEISDLESVTTGADSALGELGEFADLWESKSTINDDSFVDERVSVRTYDQPEDLELENLDLNTLSAHEIGIGNSTSNSIGDLDFGAEFSDEIDAAISEATEDKEDIFEGLGDSEISSIDDAMAALEEETFLGNRNETANDWETSVTDEIFDMDLSSEDLSVLESISRESGLEHRDDEKVFGNRTIDNLVDFFDSEETPEPNDGNGDLNDDLVAASADASFNGADLQSEVNSGITSEASYSMDQTNPNLGVNNQGISDDLDLDALAALIDEPTVLFEGNAAGQGGSSQGGIGNGTSDAGDFDSLDDLEALINSQNPSTAAPAPSITQIHDTRGDSVDPPTAKGDDFADLENFLGTMYQKDVGPMVTKTNQRSAAPKRQKSTDGTMRVDVRHLDSLNNLVGELVVNRNLLEQDQERLQQSIVNLLHQVQLLSDVAQRMRDQYDRSLLEASLAVRRSVTAPIFGSARSHSVNNEDENSSVTSDFDGIEFDRYTTFHVLSQEIIELTVKIRESASDIEFVVSETEQVTRQLGMITTQIQDDLKQSRMVPFAQIADVLPRGVRDRAIKSGKQAELEVHGRETLIDKAILEELKDPLIHIVNNAVDHGLENMSTRTSNGKPAAGKVTVRAYHQGNQTVISISDDGGGIDAEKVKESAVRKGVRTQADVNRLTENEVYALLFEPGFSTAAKADEFKGRGVGLDVVKTALDDIRGSMMIESDLGKGTTFTIRLPLTLSISRAIFCISDRARVAFPVDGFEDMVEVPQSRIIMNEQGQTCLPWRDAILPFQHLSNLLTYNRHISRSNIYGKQENDEYCIIILRNETSYLAVQVDQFLGEFEIVIKQLEGPIPKPVGIAGATVLGDGKVMAIANVLELFDIASGRIRPLTSSEPKQISTEVEAAIDPTVLIVDDSITVRELLSLTFAKVGYRVEQAKDGQDAWEKLRAGLPCDLIFCDIEMPRMDGLELLSRLQKDGRLSQIPVAMLTSRGADRHRQTAVQYGAKGYFTKPYLEEELLSASNRLLKGENLVS